MKYSRKRVLAQVSATSLKSAKLPVGLELTIEAVRTGELKDAQGNDVPNDVLICNSAKGRIAIPMREYTRFRTADNSPMWTGEGSTEVELHERFKIASSEDRKTKDGQTIYPIFAYKAIDEQLKTNAVDWNALVESGLKDNHGYDAVQNYTTEVL